MEPKFPTRTNELQLWLGKLSWQCVLITAEHSFVNIVNFACGLNEIAIISVTNAASVTENGDSVTVKREHYRVCGLIVPPLFLHSTHECTLC